MNVVVLKVFITVGELMESVVMTVPVVADDVLTSSMGMGTLPGLMPGQAVSLLSSEVMATVAMVHDAWVHGHVTSHWVDMGSDVSIDMSHCASVV